jgi:hypothetical protein
VLGVLAGCTCGVVCLCKLQGKMHRVDQQIAS